jgi:hypothetical protein
MAEIQQTIFVVITVVEKCSNDPDGRGRAKGSEFFQRELYHSTNLVYLY